MRSMSGAWVKGSPQSAEQGETSSEGDDGELLGEGGNQDEGPMDDAEEEGNDEESKEHYHRAGLLRVEDLEGLEDEQKAHNKQDSLFALKQIVEHVCQNQRKSEPEIKSLKGFIIKAMQTRSDKISQSILRDYLKQLDRIRVQPGDDEMEEKADDGSHFGDDDNDDEFKGDSEEEEMDVAPQDLEHSSHSHERQEEEQGALPATRATAATASQEHKEESTGACAVSALVPVVALLGDGCALCTSPIGYMKTRKLGCAHAFCQECIQSYILDLVGKKKAVGIACPR